MRVGGVGVVAVVPVPEVDVLPVGRARRRIDGERPGQAGAGAGETDIVARQIRDVENGVRNYVIDPASVQVDRRARRLKTDVDVTKLLRSLMAYLPGEPKVWSIVRVPTIDEEDDRRLHRERDRLINDRLQHVNRIKGLCAVHGIYHYEPLRSDPMKRLEQLRTGGGRQLSPRLKAEIRPELQRLELVLQMIKTIEKERNAMALGKAPSTYGNAKKVQQLVKIGSIGPEIATVLVGEVFFRQFNNRQKVGSYVGLTPSLLITGQQRTN